MGDSPRLESLRRRVLADPASIAFAALAEEYRRAGQYAEAVETARAGLERHPSYASARVTLGRALFESGETDSARQELEQALTSAPENLAALRALAELYRSTGVMTRARDLARRGTALAPEDREWKALAEALDGPATRSTSPPVVIPFHQAGRTVTGSRGVDEAPTVPVEAPRTDAAAALDDALPPAGGDLHSIGLPAALGREAVPEPPEAVGPGPLAALAQEPAADVVPVASEPPAPDAFNATLAPEAVLDLDAALDVTPADATAIPDLPLVTDADVAPVQAVPSELVVRTDSIEAAPVPVGVEPEAFPPGVFPPAPPMPRLGLEPLERWLDAIVQERQRRAATRS